MAESFDVSMDLMEGFQFRVDLGVEGGDPIVMDEPPPLGGGGGPNAARLLAAAVGNCLSSSALFCMRKARVEVIGMRTEVQARTSRTDTGRIRIHRIEVSLHPEVSEADRDRINRCLDLFEDFCMVTESVRAGVEVVVDVEPVVAADALASS
ncbi:MAG: OsmC family protein [Gemmatimonadota bacterium]|nr:OsmC family protein [Gemmatimonadota bacterium]